MNGFLMSDIPANTTTSVTISVGGTYAGTLETTGDRDWVRVSLTRNDIVQSSLTSTGDDPLVDSYLRIYNASGIQVDFNDDVAFVNYNSGLTYQASATGTYYIEAASYDDNYTGDYTIAVQAGPAVAPTAPAGPLTSLAWGSAIDAEVVNVYFATDGETFDGYTSEGFNSYERGQIIEIMSELSNVIDLDFNIVTDASAADMTLLLDLDEISNETDPFLGYFNPPGEFNAGVGVFNGTFWDRTASGDLEQGGFGYVTVVHELLHGMGMAHPHDNGGTSTVMSGVTSAFGDYGNSNLNQGIYTVMTYNSGYFTGSNGSAPANASAGDFGFEGGAMALDIAYLQLLYGENTTHASGGNTYFLAGSNTSGTFWESIWDTGGTDEIRYGGSRDATIDLRAATLQYETGGGGFISAADGIAGGFTIANGVIIENATGGNGDDDITGNDFANVLIGRGGDDAILGRRGADDIYGKKGTDTLMGGAGADTLRGGTGADKMKGGRGADTVTGGRGSDDVRGGRGQDVIKGGNGTDVLTGGAGADTFAFSSLSHSRGSKIDTITDFRRTVDVIDLSDIDANKKRGGNQDFDFIGTADFSGRGQLRIERDGQDIIVQADVNGDGRTDFEIVVEDFSSLSQSDFIL